MSRGPTWHVKRLVARALFASRILQLALRLTMRRKVVVLTYHRVLSREDAARTWSHPAIVVTRDTFERHLEVIRRFFRPLSLPEFSSYLSGQTALSGPACLVTFDDGWRDTFEEAWPLLQRYRVPAVVFIPVDLIGQERPFWQEALGEVLFAAWTRARRDVEFRNHILTTLQRAEVAGVLDAEPNQAHDRIRAAVNALKARPVAVAQQLLATLSAELAIAPSPLDRLMDWPQVQSMARDGIVFGGHGATHRILTTLAGDELRAEVLRSKAPLSPEIAGEVTAFCYPNGDWNAEVADAVRGAGYQIAFSTRAGHVEPTDDRLALRRINISEDRAAEAPMFLATVLGFL
jgi:peptidoglycan/xylan/chitin deacetylase (PgdA/CDA1 family)